MAVNQKGGVGEDDHVHQSRHGAGRRRAPRADRRFRRAGAASTGLGISRAERLRTSYDIIADRIPLEEAVLSTIVPRLDIVPGDENLSGVEVELASDSHRSILPSEGSAPHLCDARRNVVRSREVRLHPDRLPAFAFGADGQCDDRFGRAARSAAMRALALEGLTSSCARSKLSARVSTRRSKSRAWC